MQHHGHLFEGSEYPNTVFLAPNAVISMIFGTQHPNVWYSAPLGYMHVSGLCFRHSRDASYCPYFLSLKSPPWRHNHLRLKSKPPGPHNIKWGFSKIGGTLLRVPIMRIIVFWGLYSGPPIWDFLIQSEIPQLKYVIFGGVRGVQKGR